METPPYDFLKEAMIQDSSWLVHFISVFRGEWQEKTACPSYNLDFFQYLLIY